MNDYFDRDKVKKETESIFKTLNREKVSVKVTTKETVRNNRKNPKEIDLWSRNIFNDISKHYSLWYNIWYINVV